MSDAHKYILTDANFSLDMRHRYTLARVWSKGPRLVLWVGLNPSTADERDDDPTIRREVNFSKAWGFDGLFKCNVYAYRSTDPKVLKTVPDAVGDYNREAIEAIVMQPEVELIVAAWGQNQLSPEAEAIAAWLVSLPNTKCLGFTKSGCPKHPLYVPGNTALVDMEGGR